MNSKRRRRDRLLFLYRYGPVCARNLKLLLGPASSYAWLNNTKEKFTRLFSCVSLCFFYFMFFFFFSYRLLFFSIKEIETIRNGGTLKWILVNLSRILLFRQIKFCPFACITIISFSLIRTIRFLLNYYQTHVLVNAHKIFDISESLAVIH